MNNFISLLDTTLHLNKEDEKSEEEEDNESKVIVEVEEPPSPNKNGAIHKSASLPSKL